MRNKITRKASSRIQSAACLAGNGVIEKGSWPARAMSAAYRNEPLSKATGIPSTLIKFGLFCVLAGAAIFYFYGDNLVEIFSPSNGMSNS